jgi:hypothetical protein
MPTISFHEVYDKSFEHCHKNDSIKSALQIMWDSGASVFEKLYGNKAQEVIRLCFEVSPRFCLHVVTVVYGMHWNWSDPSDYDKALMTNVALILDRSFNQFKVLMFTFLHSAKNENKDGYGILLEAVTYMTDEGWLLPQNKEKAELIIKSEPGYDALAQSSCLSSHDKSIVKLAALAALKKNAIEVDLSDEMSLSSMNNCLFHASTYLGCPRVWDGSMEVNNHYNQV